MASTASSVSASVTPQAARAAIVIGGSRGIGAAIVRRLAADGLRVAFTWAGSQASAEGLRDELAATGAQVLALRADAADPAALAGAIDQAAEAFGRLDVLVHNAGIYRGGTIDQVSLQDLDSTLAVNVRAVVLSAQAAARHLREGGRIVLLGSTNADRVPGEGASVYAMSKAALVGFTRGLARDLGPRGITVNNIQPGPVDTDMNPAGGEHAGAMHAIMALPRHGRPEEVAAMVGFVASPQAAFVTGASLNVDGGYAA